MMDRATFELCHEIASKRDKLAEAFGQVVTERNALLDTVTELRMADREQRQVIAGLRHDLEQQRAGERAQVTRLEDAMHAIAAHRDRLVEQAVDAEHQADLLEAIVYARDELIHGLRVDHRSGTCTLETHVREMVDFLTAFAPKPAGNGQVPALARPGGAA